MFRLRKEFAWKHLFHLYENFIREAYDTCVKLCRKSSQRWPNYRNLLHTWNMTFLKSLQYRSQIWIMEGPCLIYLILQKEHWNQKSAERSSFRGVDGPCCCELTSYSSDPALLSVLLLLPLFVVITEDYGFKASAKSENLGWFSKTGKNYALVWARGKECFSCGSTNSNN